MQSSPESAPECIELFLPFPPSINDYYGNQGHIKFVRAKGNQFRKDVRDAVFQQLGPNFPVIDWKMKIDIIEHMPDRRKRDLDNYLKALLDSLSPLPKHDWPGIWEDDSLIDQLTIKRGECVKEGVVIMTITEAEEVVKWTR
jgi:crossover junction endodeoxyribonuclease RusA